MGEELKAKETLCCEGRKAEDLSKMDSINFQRCKVCDKKAVCNLQDKELAEKELNELVKNAVLLKGRGE